MVFNYQCYGLQLFRPPISVYADCDVEFPDILLSVPTESLSEFPCSAVSDKLTTAAEKVNTSQSLQRHR